MEADGVLLGSALEFIPQDVWNIIHQSMDFLTLVRRV
jgi:hypothetical protein